jgi:hypothetical protein
LAYRPRLRSPFLFYPWNLVVLTVVVICAFPREVRFYPDGSVVSAIRFLALVPVWWRQYPRSALREIRLAHASGQVGSSPEIVIDTVWLVLTSGRNIPIQSYSDGAMNSPPRRELLATLRTITTLDVV